MNKEDFNQANNLVNDLKSQFDKLMDLNNQMLSDLSADNMPFVKEVMSDVNRLKEAFKKGDENAINELNKKYASHRNK
jgi:hypothetical protein